MSKAHPLRRSRLIRGGIVAATIAATVIASATPAFAAVTVTLNSSNGPSDVANVNITATHTTQWLAGVTTPVATLSLPSCQTTYNSTASSAVTPSTATVGNIVSGFTTAKVTNYKAMITLPSIPQSPPTATSTKYNLCIYSGSATTDVLLGSAQYTVAVAATLDSTAVAPATGPATGGTLITVSGTGFPTTASAITATLGGTPLTSITPINSTKFTAITPYHASGSVALAVTTAAGTATKQSAFTYANGINISPNTAPNTSAANPVFIDVIGSGFQSYGAFGTTTLATNRALTPGPRVLLVDGVFSSVLTNVDNYTVGPSAECGSVAVISDSELICSINLNTGAMTPATAVALGTAVPKGTYTLTVTSNAKVHATPASLPQINSDLSSGATFTVSDY
jgi:hypothetical protein